ncbi:MAG: RNA pseudouridine synthase [Flavobacteriales bacterium]|nr:RNA pseudouridine synthase [Flavobacteriales bacterium]
MLSNDQMLDNEMYEHHFFEVEKNHDLIRIDKFLLLRISNTTRTKIQKSISAGNVFCNNSLVKSNYKVKPNDKISIRFEYEPYNKEIIPENIPLDVVFEDNDIVIINKPSNMVVHPSYGHYSGTLIHALLHRFKDIKVNNDNQRPGLVHRLDKNTTGLIVIARNEDALTYLSAQFASRTIKRTYVALVWGDVKEEKGTITGNIGRNKKNRKIMTVFQDENEGKHAVTHYEVLERFRYVTLVKCHLETGRTHQIRVHMKHIGHPLFNDNEYGGDKILRGTTFSKYKQFVQNCFQILPRQALHATNLSLRHPKNDELVSFQVDLPADLHNVVDRWRKYVYHQLQ